MHITCPIPGPNFRCALQVLVWKQYTLYPSSLTLPMYIHILGLKSDEFIQHCKYLQ